MTLVAGTNAVTRAPRPSSLADVLDLILDKGLVVDAYVRVSAVGIEVLTIDARVVIASVDTYLHYAEAVNRLDLRPTEMQGIPELADGGDDSDGADGRREERDRHRQSNRSDEEEERRGLAARLGERGRWDQ